MAKNRRDTKMMITDYEIKNITRAEMCDSFLLHSRTDRRLTAVSKCVFRADLVC